MSGVFKAIVSAFTTTKTTSGGLPLTSAKKIWFNITSAVTLITPIVGLATGLVTFKEVFSYMEVIFPMASATYAIGKYVDGNNFSKTKKALDESQASLERYEKQV